MADPTEESWTAMTGSDSGSVACGMGGRGFAALNGREEATEVGTCSSNVELRRTTDPSVTYRIIYNVCSAHDHSPKRQPPTFLVFTVFGDRAEVVRIVRVSAKQGTQEVRINGLSESPEVKPRDETELKQRIERLRRRLGELAKGTSRLDREKELLSQFIDRSIDNPQRMEDFSSDENVNKLDNFLSFYSDNNRRLDHQKVDREDERRKLVEEIEQIENEIAVSGYVSDADKERRVVITFSTTAPTDIMFKLVYVVSGASWVPQYDLRVTASDSGANTLSVTYYGTIRQTTDEDWKNAHISLSTAAATSTSEAPELKPRTIKYEDFSSFSGKKKKEDYFGMPRMLSSMVAPGGSMPPPAPRLQVMKATARTNALSTTFDIPRRAEILSNGKPHKVVITVFDMTPKMEYYAVAGKSDYVFLRATAENKTENTLLPGKANVFLNENFISTSTLEAEADTTLYRIMLGIDQDIRLKYEAVKTVVTQSGVIRKTKEVKVEHKATLSNAKKKAVTVLFHDQLPLSADSSIKIKMQEPEDLTKAKAKLIEETNTIQWTVSLEPGASTTIPFKFNVEHPADQIIQGLEEEADA
ncbi:hypothetical protein PROFUN_08801 [Planoprotostelium fungivorum]|uniref:DUF4139 domain-containing protein n=1 Tax=Planoprotostelium fungivorum TaxID=1890364 RepID=A0A2P6MVS7_9EUKA|nr:hypothetical protein PROFUN_08801 [Planoprotostelium fungivorum]